MKRHLLFAALILLAVASGGCGGPKVYRDEGFASESPYRHNYDMSQETACEGAEFALLNQGYTLDAKAPTALKARKNFQPEEEINVVIEFNVVCKADKAGSVVFANAVQTTYELKKSSGSSSLSIPSAGSISLPWGKTVEALVKIAGETISDESFYSRFFALVSAHLKAPPK